jgi:hypothetical protein
MAIQVTGLFKNPQSNQLFLNPKLELNPHLSYRGQIKLQVDIVSDFSGSFTSEDIDKNTLVYNHDIIDPYTQIIDALENYVILRLSPFNQECVFIKDSDVIIEEENNLENE